MTSQTHPKTWTPKRISKALVSIAALILALLGQVTRADAQGTVMPIPLAQWFDNTGAVLGSGGMCVFAAGTTTLANTYTTAALTVANADPIIFSSAGRPVSGGVFLTPGTSYKFVLKDFTGVVTPTCVPDTGTTIWSVDNVSALPTSSANIDISGTAGESFITGTVGYLSDGSGGKNAGQFYLADADLPYAGALPMLAMAVTDIASGSQGAFRLIGRHDGLSGLTPGTAYYLSTAAGALTATPPLVARLIGQAESTTQLVLSPNPRTTPIMPRAPCGRLSLTTGVPVTTTDVTAAGTLYYIPYGGCSQVTFFDGTAWYQSSFSQISIAVPAVASQMYDVFLFDNAGTPTLELTAWTNDTTRATALATQNGVYVKTGALTRLYLGSFRTTTVVSQTEDSGATCTGNAKRYVWNYYNRVLRPLCKNETTDNWTYTTGAWRQVNGAAGNQLDVVVGVSEDALEIDAYGVSASDTANTQRQTGIGEDSTTVLRTGTVTPLVGTIAATIGTYDQTHAHLRVIPAAGRHFYAWLEYSTQPGGAITTWFGDTPVVSQTGIMAMWKS